MAGKMYDILLLGSTGFTGQMVLEYFLKNYEKEIKNEKIKILCAVRDINKLNKYLSYLKEEEKISNIEKIHLKDNVNATSYESVLSCCKLCKVVINTVGPFTLYGYNIVKACIESNCHYIDVSGEHNFILNIYKEFDKTAKEKKLKIIHSASFISAVSDIGNYIIQNEFIKKYKKPCSYVRIRLSKEGHEHRTISSGTLRSFLLARKYIHNRYNKYFLCNNKYDVGELKDNKYNFVLNKINEEKNKYFFSDYEKEFGYCSDTIYSHIEEAYILWSNYLLNYKYGKNLIVNFKQYDTKLSTTMYIIKKVFSFLFAPFKYVFFNSYIINKYIELFHIPKTAKELKKSHWSVSVVGELYDLEKEDDKSNKQKKSDTNNKNTKQITDNKQDKNSVEKKMVLHMKGQNEDAGYLLSAKIIAEGALSLLQSKLPDKFGVISVSVGLGNALVERLKNALINIYFE
ncbi:conserved protein, unknown function [Hepatocystis sp. ex Piliocolobus tephrosceles]|nr:conserved protein, unknown function [Hepatocystis sp. ex Piliocolobus tephrosceles]